jgi:hypothetical protein
MMIKNNLSQASKQASNLPVVNPQVKRKNHLSAHLAAGGAETGVHFLF